MQEPLYLIGSGGLGREMAATLEHPQLRQRYSLAGFIDDGREAGTTVHGLTVLGGLEVLRQRAAPAALLCIGHPVVRQNIVQSLRDTPVSWPTILHPAARIYAPDHIELGQGIWIGEGTILTTDIAIGDHCLVHLGCSLHHDTKIGACTVLMPGVRITGGAHIPPGIRIETGTCITSAGPYAP